MSYLDSKRQLGVVEEAPEKVRTAAEALDLLANSGLDLLNMVRVEVGESAVLEVGPDLLHGVEFRGIGREPFRMPGGMLAEVTPHLAVAMRASEIPEQDEGPRVVSPQSFEEPKDLRATDVPVGMQGQVEMDALATRGDDQGPDAGDLLVRSGSDKQLGGLPPQAPSPSDQGGHQEAGLVEADQAGVEAREFFLMRGHSC